MNLQLLAGLTCVSASVASLLLFAPSASASSCEPAAQARWNPARSWPSSCELNVPLDGFVLLEGDALPADESGGEGGLMVFVQRVEAGVVLERFDGVVSQIDATSALFRSERALLPNADYVLVAGRFAPDGTPLGPSFSSAFTTGSTPLASVAFAQPAVLELEHSKKAVQICAADECGGSLCEPTGETREVRIVRIEVPPIEGGIAQRPYAVTAQLAVAGSETQAARVATSDTVVTQAGKRSFIVLEVPELAAAAQGCVTIDAQDIAGHAAHLDAGCLALPAEPAAALPSPVATTPTAQSEGAAQPASSEGTRAPVATAVDHVASDELPELAFESDIAAVEEGEGDPRFAEGAGCSVGGTTAAEPANLAWLTLALGWLVRRSRKR